ncbi:MAG: UDP-glucose 4-epimerase [Nitrospinae bacterium CG11_big_fil_rev_8_21_14_0_20_56_8]|nr:MAG: UDP-glucose 4-epimerase [Nitrospinae bacterium CG11_big_fil_rev_8_21_14_0_20_56_8]
MNVLVTGGAGFIGSHIVKAFMDAGHRVVILDNLSSGKREFIPEGVKFYQRDLLDPEIGDILGNEKIEAINHHAAQISVRRSTLDPEFDAKSNILGTLHLLRNAVSLGVRKFVFASTGGALYGKQREFPATENHPCCPYSPYGISKYSGEHYLRFFGENHDLETVVLRYSNVYGPHQDPLGEAGVVAIFCQRLLKRQPLVVYGDGGQTRDFISVSDVVRANEIALTPGCSGVFNIGTGKETSINTLSRLLIDLSGIKVQVKYEPARPGEQKRSCIDSTLFLSQFGWKPKMPLEEGLLEAFRYFEKNSV